MLSWISFHWEKEIFSGYLYEADVELSVVWYKCQGEITVNNILEASLNKQDQEKFQNQLMSDWNKNNMQPGLHECEHKSKALHWH